MKLRNVLTVHDDCINVYGTNRWQKIHYSNTKEPYQFVYHMGMRYKLDCFVMTKRNPWGDAPTWMQAYDGHHSDSFFSGILIKLSDCGESAKVFTYIA